jgi:hypothetical protein
VVEPQIRYDEGAVYGPAWENGAGLRVKYFSIGWRQHRVWMDRRRLRQRRLDGAARREVRASRGSGIDPSEAQLAFARAQRLMSPSVAVST